MALTATRQTRTDLPAQIRRTDVQGMRLVAVLLAVGFGLSACVTGPRFERSGDLAEDGTLLKDRAETAQPAPAPAPDKAEDRTGAQRTRDELPPIALEEVGDGKTTYGQIPKVSIEARPVPDSITNMVLPEPTRKLVLRSPQTIFVPGGPISTVETTSILTERYRGLIPQQYDFSCGAAALATLLTFHYGLVTTEQEVFKAMYALGERERIEKEGFSLLDMKNYLASRGIRSSGFEVTLQEIQDEGVPAIQLINLGGYFHFVVIRGINDKQVLISDPALGTLYYDRETFDKMRANNISFVIIDSPAIGRANFDRSKVYANTLVAPEENQYRADIPDSLRELLLPAANEIVLQGLQ